MNICNKWKNNAYEQNGDQEMKELKFNIFMAKTML